MSEDVLVSATVTGVAPERSTTGRLLAELASGPAMDHDTHWPIGEVLLGEMRVEEHLGAGAFGSVTLVRSQLTDRRFALKTLHPDLVATERGRSAFAVELATWIDLQQHPHVVRAHFVRRLHGHVGVFTEYVDGGTLFDAIHGGRFTTPEQMGDVLHQVAAGLDHAHQHGVVHADVKPENVLLTAGGEAKVGDFGLAVAAGTRADDVMTVPYRSPEQADRRELTPATDVWSFGLTALTMLVGQRFWLDGHQAALVLQRLDPLVRARLAPATLAALARCFALHPAERWPSVPEAAEAMFPRGKPHIRSLSVRKARPAIPQRPVERWLMAAFEQAGRSAEEARAAFPSRRYHETGQALADLDGFERAEPLLTEQATPSLLAAFHRDWAATLETIGDLSAAREHARQSVAVLKPGEQTDWLFMAETALEAAGYSDRCGDPAEGAELVRIALLLLDAAEEPGRPGSPAVTLARGRAHTHAATCSRTMSRFDEALQSADKAVEACRLAIERGVHEGRRTFYLALAEMERAMALRWLRRLDQAVDAFRVAIDRFGEAGYRHTANAVRVTRAGVLGDLGLQRDALAEMGVAIEQFEAEAPSGSLIDELVLAHNQRARILVARKDWNAALLDLDRVRLLLEREVYENGRSEVTGLLAQAQLHCVSALCRVGQDREAVARLDGLIAFLHRLRRLGLGQNMCDELWEAHRSAALAALNGIRLVAATRHADLSAEFAEERRVQEPGATADAVEAAVLAAQLLIKFGNRSRVTHHVARAASWLEDVESTDARRSLTASVRELEVYLASQESSGASSEARDVDLTYALAALLIDRDGATALDCARGWTDGWIGRCIAFSARSFFLYDPRGAAEVFGGMEALVDVVNSDRVERHFLQGLGALLREDLSAGAQAFLAAMRHEAGSAFVLFAYYYAVAAIDPGSEEAREAGRLMAVRAAAHPLLQVAKMLKGPLDPARAG